VAKKHKKAYLQKLKDPRWQKFKALVHIRDNWTCLKCGASHKTLVAHHRKYWGEPWEAPFEQVITLCVNCHDEVHEDGAWTDASTEAKQPEFISIIYELKSYGAYPEVSPNGELWIRGSKKVPRPTMVRARYMTEEILEWLAAE
jgi:hypothetical protein